MKLMIASVWIRTQQVKWWRHISSGTDNSCIYTRIKVAISVIVSGSRILYDTLICTEEIYTAPQNWGTNVTNVSHHVTIYHLSGPLMTLHYCETSDTCFNWLLLPN